MKTQLQFQNIYSIKRETKICNRLFHYFFAQKYYLESL